MNTREAVQSQKNQYSLFARLFALLSILSDKRLRGCLVNIVALIIIVTIVLLVLAPNNHFHVPTRNSQPSGITAGPDGNLWFTESNGNKIGRVTSTGTITEFAIPTSGSQPNAITTGSDGNLWFTESNANKIGRITPDGNVTEPVALPPWSQPKGITAKPDGNLWFTGGVGIVCHITTSGAFAGPPVFTFGIMPDGISEGPDGITVGPDGNLWFTEFNGNEIGWVAAGR